MRTILFILIGLVSCAAAKAQLTTTPHGLTITVDTITTEVCVYAPEVVRVTKYIGTRPALSSSAKLNIKADALPDTLAIVNADGKTKIDTGRFYAAVNTKDGNVSFWDHDGNLILAEQHKSASLTPVNGKKGRYSVRQDFQIGKSKADSIYCPALTAAKRTNLKGLRTKFGDKTAGLPQRLVSTDRGYSIYWNTPGEGYIDDTPGRQVKKSGDVTISSPRTTAIDYYFLLR